jgi:hypothetical protein
LAPDFSLSHIEGRFAVRPRSELADLVYSAHLLARNTLHATGVVTVCFDEPKKLEKDPKENMS